MKERYLFNTKTDEIIGCASMTEEGNMAFELFSWAPQMPPARIKELIDDSIEYFRDI